MSYDNWKTTEPEPYDEAQADLEADRYGHLDEYNAEDKERYRSLIQLYRDEAELDWARQWEVRQ